MHLGKLRLWRFLIIHRSSNQVTLFNSQKGLCPLTFAVQNDIPSAVAYLMSVPSVDVNVLMPDGRFPLLIASETDDRIQCISLLANAADIDLNKESTEGMTSLMVAVAENRLLALQALLAFGADVNYRSRLLGMFTVGATV